MTMHLWQSGMTPAFVAHLLQSTAFAAAAWLLTLALGRYPARVRFWVWMGASIKFLLPFALLTNFGARWATPQPQAAHTGFYTVIEEFSRPFVKADPAGPALSAQPLQARAWGLWFLAAVWLCGCLILLGRWIRQWQTARRIVRDAAPSHDGPVILALRSTESQTPLRRTIPVLLTSRAVEPGIFGITRPALVWPAGLSERLDNAQIQAIVEHELEHVRRRDNLISSLHAVVEALFWFHPALYWIGSKMRDERERACDESVIERNAPPERYADSILKVCAFCLEAPSPCIAGVSGSDLKKRVLRILNHRSGTPLTFGRRALLSTVALSAIALPVGIGVVHGQTGAAAIPSAADTAPHDLPKYEVASIKPAASTDGRTLLHFTPDGTSIQGMPVQFLLQQAFGVEKDRIIGAPSWVQANRYDIEAKVSPENAPKVDRLKADERRTMLIPLLVERFDLKYHHETRDLPMYALVVAKGGAKLKSSTPEPANEPPGSPFAGGPPSGLDSRGRMMMAPGRIESSGTSIDMLAHALAPQLGRSVVDKTGLTGRYDYTLQWTPDNAPPPIPGGSGPAREATDSDAASVSLFTAIQEQLGLKLESEKSTVDVIVIDHIELPSAN